MDRPREIALLLSPPRFTKLDSNLDRWSILEFTNGTPLGIIVIDIDSIKVHEAEARQWNSRNDGGVFLRGLNPIDRDPHKFLLGIAGNSSDRTLEQGIFL